MSEELQKQIEELKGMVQMRRATDGNGNQAAAKYLKWIQGIIGVSVIVVGLGINWGISQTKISVQAEKIAALENRLEDRVGKLNNELHELQLKQAKDDQILITIQEGVAEIRKDVKALAERL